MARELAPERVVARGLRGCLLSLLVLPLLLALPRHAAAQAVDPDHLHDMMRWGRQTLLLAEALEYAPAAADRPIGYDILGWTGGASRRVWFKADGHHGTRDGMGATSLQLLYGQLVTPWWDAQVGVRVDLGYGGGESRTRTSLALGVQGLAPGWFEVDPTIFVSQDGDISASLEASYDLLLTQRLVLQPQVETSVALQDAPESGVGSGVNDLEVGLRLRYEIIREVAPYAGVAWSSRFGETADLARAAGAPVRDLQLVIGMRLWR